MARKLRCQHCGHPLERPRDASVNFIHCENCNQYTDLSGGKLRQIGRRLGVVKTDWTDNEPLIAPPGASITLDGDECIPGGALRPAKLEPLPDEPG